MCIRDRCGIMANWSRPVMSPSRRTKPSRRSGIRRRSGISTRCLLYTSRAADEEDRRPSRGLGDVYKRQVWDNGKLVAAGNVTIPADQTIPQVGDTAEVRYLYALSLIHISRCRRRG